MKNSKALWVVIVVVIIGVIWYMSSSSSTPATPDTSTGTSDSAVVSQTSKVTSKTSKYQNAELGFAVDYPSDWEVGATDTGVSFIMPIDSTQVSSMNKLQSDITVSSGKCAFPPVATIKDRGTITVAGKTLNMISMSNTVQGRSYFNRMYSLQNDSVCYFFSFASVALSPDAKGLTGSNVAQAQNNNKAITTSADTAFTDMVKSFVFVTGPQGVDETKAPINKTTTSAPKTATTTSGAKAQ